MERTSRWNFLLWIGERIPTKKFHATAKEVNTVSLFSYEYYGAVVIGIGNVR